MADKLNAADVVDVEYLRRIARPHDLAWTTDPRTALEIFAYQFTEAADAAEQNRILRELLVKMMAGHSRKTNTEVLRYLANKFNTQAGLLTEFARQEGVYV